MSATPLGKKIDTLISDIKQLEQCLDAVSRAKTDTCICRELSQNAMTLMRNAGFKVRKEDWSNVHFKNGPPSPVTIVYL